MSHFPDKSGLDWSTSIFLPGISKTSRWYSLRLYKPKASIQEFKLTLKMQEHQKRKRAEQVKEEERHSIMSMSSNQPPQEDDQS
jgi:hypothetical protein